MEGEVIPFMAGTVLTPDYEITFPDFTLLRASAGSGKTRALAHRYIQFVLSSRIQNNKPSNILAITFSNNAAREMRQRILEWMKKAHLGDVEHLSVLEELLSLNRSAIQEQAGETVDEILDNYSDFQVRTIDSFMASVFKSLSLELGLSPKTEIVVQKNQLIDYAFDLYFRKVYAESPEAKVIESVVDKLEFQRSPENRFLWDPSQYIATTFKSLYTELASIPREVVALDYSKEKADELVSEIVAKIKGIEAFVIENGLEFDGRAQFTRAIRAAEEGNFDYFIGRRHNRNLIKKGRLGTSQFEVWDARVNQMKEELNDLYARYNEFYAYSFYHPHIEYLNSFISFLHQTKREKDQIFIDDIGRKLSQYVNSDIVPHVYVMMGETISHYLIDEFQDTSPIQWTALLPLIENALANRGSLFTVGDTKQAIYSFRGADFRIMKSLEEKQIFASAPATVKNLDTNYRSCEYVLSYNEALFEAILTHPEYGNAAKLSGLDHHTQRPFIRNRGYAESAVFWSHNAEDQTEPERLKIIQIIEDAVQRGYSYRDIAILTFRNTHVTTISAWLSERGIDFVSLSNLDVRKRKIIGELISFLKFLNAPIDDLAFASFLLGDIAKEGICSNEISRDDLHLFVARAKNSEQLRFHPLYKNFQKEYPTLWDTYFDQLFNHVGHHSIYDLANEIYKTFDLYARFPDEEASLMKFIEAIKNFEAQKTNSLRAFLDFVNDEEAEDEWNLDRPENVNAVQLMTVHKAKGLGFPIVIFVLYNDYRSRGNLHFDEKNGELTLLYINADVASASPYLKELYESQRCAKLADYLNSLYVAVTRAMEELYVVAVPPKRTAERSIFHLLPEEPFGEKMHRQTSPTQEEPLTSPFHHTHAARFNFGEEMPLNIPELRRGEAIHSVLSRIIYDEETTDAEIQSLVNELQGYGNGGTTTPLELNPEDLLSVIRSPDLAEFFGKQDGRTVHTEIEITDSNGNLHRIDRLVIDPDRITIIDFKTGGDTEDDPGHENQIRTYMEILRDLYPGKVIQGILSYVDKKHLRVLQ